MRYMLLINIDKTATPPQTAEMEAILHGHERFEAELQAAGKVVHTERLRSDEEATRVRLKAGQRQVTDGPFAETKEVLGGFYVIECDTRNEAIEWAKKIPLREDRTVAVRASGRGDGLPRTTRKLAGTIPGTITPAAVAPRGVSSDSRNARLSLSWKEHRPSKVP